MDILYVDIENLRCKKKEKRTKIINNTQILFKKDDNHHDTQVTNRMKPYVIRI